MRKISSKRIAFAQKTFAEFFTNSHPARGIYLWETKNLRALWLESVASNANVPTRDFGINPQPFTISGLYAPFSLSGMTKTF